jgi:hypothetical protein
MTKKIRKAVGFAITGGGLAVVLSHLALAYAG